MWGDRVSQPGVLMASALCLLFSAQTQGQHAIPPPVNLSIQSHDFHTVLKWEVPDVNRRTRFNVCFREYEAEDWKPVCLNISTHYCDLSNAFVPNQELISGYYTKIQAFIGSQTSESALTNRFTFGQNATLGPPSVLLAANGNDLTVEVKYPALNSRSSNVSFDFLSYIVYCRKQDHHKQTCREMTPKEQKQHFHVSEGVVCVSAKVQASIFGLKGNKSEETCLRIRLSNLSVSTVVIPTVLVFVILVISISALIYFHVCKKKLVLPKSLAHIIVNEKAYHVINPKTEERSQCVLLKPEEVTKDTEIDLNHELQEKVKYSSDNVDRGTINADEGSSELLNADSTDLYAAKLNISGTDLKCVDQDDIEGGLSDQDSSRDSCPTHFDSMKQNFTPANWGYDKPQFPLNMV
ncbi:interferon gamma receptor 1-like isoform X2 [Rhinoraja longicauda]